MPRTLKFLVAAGAALLLSACATTATLVTAWNNPDISKKVSQPYIIGMSKDDTRRRVFEDSAREKLVGSGVSAIASYRDLPASEETDKGMIAQKASANGADSILIVRVIDSRVEKIVEPGRVTTLPQAPAHPVPRDPTQPYVPDRHYHDYGKYYAQSYQVIYQPPREVRYKVGTVEANLYDSQSDQLLWSGQFEVLEDTPFDKLVKDFVDTMTDKLKKDGLI